MTTAEVAPPTHAAHGGHDVPQAPPCDEHFGKATGGKIAMWMFIAQDGMSFGGLLAAYGLLRIQSADWPVPNHILGIDLTAFATFVLIASSVSMVMAVEAAKSRNQQKTVQWLGLTILGGLTFLGIQAFEYTNLVHEGIGFATSTWEGVPINDRFGSTFFAVTGFHGLHVLSGVIYLTFILVGTMKGKFTRGGISYSPVEIVGLFWHFVDLVWILVFTFVYLL